MGFVQLGLLVYRLATKKKESNSFEFFGKFEEKSLELGVRGEAVQ